MCVHMHVPYVWRQDNFQDFVLLPTPITMSADGQSQVVRLSHQALSLTDPSCLPGAVSFDSWFPFRSQTSLGSGCRLCILLAWAHLALHYTLGESRISRTRLALSLPSYLCPSHHGLQAKSPSPQPWSQVAGGPLHSCGKSLEPSILVLTGHSHRLPQEITEDESVCDS